MKYKLSIISLLTSITVLCACAPSDSVDVAANTEETQAVPQTTTLGATPDMGEEYIDGFIFFGESTTYHIKNRAVLRDGKQTKQVWGPKNGTVNLDTTVGSLKIVYPDTGEEMTVGEAVKRNRPKRILLTFGLNGAVEKIRRGEEYFRACYMTLINAIRTNSPDTVIILQSCFPIAEDMDVSNYSVDTATLMEYINIINGWTLALAEDEALYYLNTVEVLVNDRGFLLDEYDVGDGHHLTSAAYLRMLEYIRTHGVTEGL